MDSIYASEEEAMEREYELNGLFLLLFVLTSRHIVIERSTEKMATSLFVAQYRKKKYKHVSRHTRLRFIFIQKFNSERGPVGMGFNCAPQFSFLSLHVISKGTGTEQVHPDLLKRREVYSRPSLSQGEATL
jgi:hypothetical protein